MLGFSTSDKISSRSIFPPHRRQLRPKEPYKMSTGAACLRQKSLSKLCYDQQTAEGECCYHRTNVSCRCRVLSQDCEGSADALFMLQLEDADLRTRTGDHQRDFRPTMSKLVPASLLGRLKPHGTHASCVRRIMRTSGEQNQPVVRHSERQQGESEPNG